MKKIVALSIIFLLSGCVSPNTQMTNNNFSELQPSTPSILSASNSNMIYKADNDLKAASLECAKEL
ncbi:hypothetical protein ACS125_13145 [Acinetobacter sp. PFS20]|uniref:hypothetical protein n=1 Tax=Acinetobacter sp. PFS20 TaxID=3458434 RepID=UPI003FD68FAF